MSELIKEKFCKPVYERALLAYCFESMSNYYIVASRISDKDLLRPEHRMIWLIFGTLIKRGVKQFDGSLVANEAKTNGVMKDIGGYEYINGIIGMDVAGSNVDFYIDRVLDASTKYELYMKLNVDVKRIGDDAANEDISANDMLSKVTSGVLELSMKSKFIKEAKNLADGLEEYIEERRTNPVSFCGLSTGYPILDKRLDGLVPGTLTVFCARPKQGKSTFLSNVGVYAAIRSKKPTLYVDTEMSFVEWRARIVSMLSGVPERRIKHGGYSDQEYYNINQAVKLIKGGKLFHEYMPGYSIDKLISIYKKYKHVEGIEFAVFDYIKEPTHDRKDRKEYQLLGDVTTVLKDIAGELNIPILCASQISRTDDVADSDRILRYADVLIFFSKKEQKDIEAQGIGAGTFKLVIKHSRRGGETPSEGIGYDFFKSTLNIVEAEVQVIDYSKKEYASAEDIEYNKEVPTDDGDEVLNAADF